MAGGVGSSVRGGFELRSEEPWSPGSQGLVPSQETHPGGCAVPSSTASGQC